jgi:chromate transporter
LFREFFKTGLFSIGGGLATLPFLYDMGDKTGWFTRADVIDMLAISESTPGPIGVNMATFTGFTCGGIPGAIVATLGLIAPSIVFVLLIALFLKSFRGNRYVQRAFYGLRPASTGMITAAGCSVFAVALFNTGLYGATARLPDLFRWEAISLAAVLWVLTNLVKRTKKLHPVVFIALSAVVGIVFGFGGA